MIKIMRTVIETTTFQRHADQEWSESERLNFVTWISENPNAGDVIPSTGGVRKIRWTASNTGKRSGVRVIYFNINEEQILLIDMYKKSKKTNISPDEIKRVR